MRSQPAEAESFFTVPWPEPPKIPSNKLSGWSPACLPVPGNSLSTLTKRASRETGIAAEILQSVIQQESANSPCAVSSKGAMGLMQLMPETAQALGVEDPFEPAQNIDAGSRFLRSLLDRYAGNLSFALAAYNAGPGRVDRTGGIPDITETRNYVQSVLERLRRQGFKPPESPVLTQPFGVPPGGF